MAPNSRNLQYNFDLCLYLARATRILHPPLKSFSFFCCIAALKPKPWRIREARISALSASSSSRRSYSSISFSHSALLGYNKWKLLSALVIPATSLHAQSQPFTFEVSFNLTFIHFIVLLLSYLKTPYRLLQLLLHFCTHSFCTNI